MRIPTVEPLIGMTSRIKLLASIVSFIQRFHCIASSDAAKHVTKDYYSYKKACSRLSRKISGDVAAIDGYVGTCLLFSAAFSAFLSSRA